MTQRTKAGENEHRFAEIMQEKAPEIHLRGKRRFSSGEVEISVDQSLEHDGICYLIEIDSQNIAKLLVGQYVLLNELCKQDKSKVFFLIVHAYEKYNPQRTLSNLQFINEKLYFDKGIKVGAIHIPTTIHNVKAPTQPVFVSDARDRHDGSSSVSMRQGK